MTDWSPPDPRTIASPISSTAGKDEKSNSLFLFWQNKIKYIGLVVAVIGSVDFYRLLELRDESRTSLAANSRALEIFDASSIAGGLAWVLTIFWLLHMRRRLKRGVIKRFPFNWKRGVVGYFLFGIQPIYWAQDIEQLAQVPRRYPASSFKIRSMKRSRNGYIWFILSMILTQITSKLDYAKLGIDYVTVGPAGMDDPLRYALKYIDPSLITTKLDQYSEIIWPACLGGSALTVLFGIATWYFLGKVSDQIRNARGSE
jgi:hypothetical protein